MEAALKKDWNAVMYDKKLSWYFYSCYVTQFMDAFDFKFILKFHM